MEEVGWRERVPEGGTEEEAGGSGWIQGQGSSPAVIWRRGTTTMERGARGLLREKLTVFPTRALKFLWKYPTLEYPGAYPLSLRPTRGLRAVKPEVSSPP
jgi:hypothetical protein